MQFDHAGIATDDAGALTEQYATLFDATVAHEEQFDGMQVVFLDFGNGFFEVLEPTTDEGAIASYLDRSGPGIHHLAVATADIVAAIEHAREAGVELIDDAPREGAWGHKVAFLHPESTGGVLLEFVEH
jgi:methylmalonyl-CoA/ethylmalonyl-CoA epimerase